LLAVAAIAAQVLAKAITRAASRRTVGGPLSSVQLLFAACGRRHMDTTTLSKFQARLGTPSDLNEHDREEVGKALLPLTADVVALFLKTKNYHWHVSGSHYKEYHELLDEQADQLFAMVDILAERSRKLGQPTLRSAGQVARITRVDDDDREYVEPHAMLRQLVEDNKDLLARMRAAHGLVDDVADVATASLLENFIDETERRIWFLYETAVGEEHTQ
jgi:starvation-inducible DNA-binding protein